MFIYSIKNEKLEFFNRPVYCESVNECLSYVQNILMSDADRALIGLRSDLALYELGTIDFVSGKIVALKKPIKVADLDKVFDSIPADRVPRFEKQIVADLDSIRERVKKLEKGVIIDGCNHCDS